MHTHTEFDKSVVDRIRNTTVQLLEQKNPKYTSSQVARDFKIDPAVVTRSLNGVGSRRVRIYIALLLDRPPSSIWTYVPKAQQVMDDYFYNHPDDLSKSIPKLILKTAKLN